MLRMFCIWCSAGSIQIIIFYQRRLPACYARRKESEANGAKLGISHELWRDEQPCYMIRHKD